MGPRRPISANKTTLMTDSSFYIYHVVFDELLKETGHGSRIIMSKYPEISSCNCQGDCLIEVTYNQILNVDRVRFIEVTV